MPAARKSTATKRKSTSTRTRKTAVARKGVSMREAAFAVFASNGNRPLKPKALYAEILRHGYVPGKGKTPEATARGAALHEALALREVGCGLHFRALQAS